MISKQTIIDYYHKNWNLFIKLWQVDETYCINYGYYEKGVHSRKQAILNMNKFIARILKLNSNSEETKYILDAGCGIGGTVVYLARQYPNIRFTGITIDSDHIKIAKQFAKQKQVISNTEFIREDYLNSNFPSNFFDAIFALESINYTAHTKNFIQEMNRILKPGGKLVVIDGFRTNIQLNPLLDKLYKKWCKKRVIPNITPSKKFKLYLKSENFIKIKDTDHTSNIGRSVIRAFLISIPYLFSISFRRIIKGYHNQPIRKPSAFLIDSIISLILGLKKVITYNAITANKNK
jgi:cyclopropane fatty-acyl-phospholipid synthase-like methyltransferase